MLLSFPSQDLTNQYISESYSNILQKYLPGGNTFYVLDILGNIIFSFPSASYGYNILTSDQTASLTSPNAISASYSLSSSYTIYSSYAGLSTLAETASLSADAISASYSFQATSASWAYSASYAPGNPSISASYSLSGSYSDYALSSSFSDKSISSSYALSASYSLPQIHNELQNIQGGVSEQYYHLTAKEYYNLQNNIKNITIVSSSYFPTGSDYTIVITGSTTTTITLPITSSSQGKLIFLKNRNNYPMYIISVDGALIDGNSSITSSFQNSSIQLQCTGSEWFIL
jgi:hypothetical protein